MTKDEALKLALEALDGWGKGFPDNWGDLDTEAVNAIKEALAQPEQEPVAKCTESDSWNCKYCRKTESCKALQDPRNFTAPPPVAEPHKRPSRSDIKPLTDEEIILIVADCASSHQHTDIHFARAIEQAHGIKGLV